MSDANAGIPGVTGAIEIGRGGFGVVYRATETDLGRDVAVKVLSGQLDDRSELRFERERRAMGTLSGHPNIVTIFRSGTTEQRALYLVMEYLPGGSLAERLASSGPLELEETLRIGVELAGALETAHRAGVLHRDIKPGNVMMDSLGRAKLGDFGIARLDGSPETKSAVVTASVAHAPPEVIAGHKPDERSDIYSLGSTLFELASGSPAFARQTDESMIPMFARIANEPTPNLRERGVPHVFAEVLERAMSKQSAQRFTTAAEFGRALTDAQRALGHNETRLWLEGEPPPDRPARPATQVVPPPVDDSWAPPPPPPPTQQPPQVQNPAPPTQNPAQPSPAAYQQPPAQQPAPARQPPPAPAHQPPPAAAQQPHQQQPPAPAQSPVPGQQPHQQPPPAPQQPSPSQQPASQQPAAYQQPPQQQPHSAHQPPGTGGTAYVQPPPSVGYPTPNPAPAGPLPTPNQFAAPPGGGGFPNQPAGVGPQPSGKKSNTGLIAASAIGVLLLVAGIASIAVAGNNEDPEPEAFVDASGSDDDSSGSDRAEDTTSTTVERTTTIEPTTTSAPPPTIAPRADYLRDLPSLPSVEQPYAGYKTISDSEDAFTVRVPIEWPDVLSTEGQVVSSPDNNAALGNELISGLVVSGSQGIGIWDADLFLDELLTELADPDNPCTQVKREPFADGPFDGLIYAELCRGGDMLIVEVLVSSADRESVILVAMQMTDERDMAAFEEVLASFTLFDPAGLPTAS